MKFLGLWVALALAGTTSLATAEDNGMEVLVGSDCASQLASPEWLGKFPKYDRLHRRIVNAKYFLRLNGHATLRIVTSSDESIPDSVSTKTVLNYVLSELRKSFENLELLHEEDRGGMTVAQLRLGHADVGWYLRDSGATLVGAGEYDDTQALNDLAAGAF